ncbi:tetraspanin-9-like [Saccostrea echinata]|uniref:tetraspanin-9-like n=1 Tax=Saccostrea echinata TaxID=191078 RepID=UPI002A7FD385|nr:tetraspanin-9-like [Saccostrea echinata]
MLILPGILILANVKYIDENVKPLMKTLSYGDVNLADVADGLSISMIILGTFTVLVAVLGLCGACKSNKKCLCVYSIIVLTLLVLQLVGVALWAVANDKVTNSIKSELLTNLQTHYTKEDLSSHEISTAWNYLFMKLSCCGVNDNQNMTNDFTNPPWKASSGSKKIPIFCCTGINTNNYNLITFTSCTDHVDKGFYNTGCYSAVESAVSTYTLYFIATGCIILGVEIVGLVCACCLCKNIGKKNQEVSPRKKKKK